MRSLKDSLKYHQKRCKAVKHILTETLNLSLNEDIKSLRHFEKNFII
jgi:hypothetical protein